MQSDIPNVPCPQDDEQRVSYPIVRCDQSERFKLEFWSLSKNIHGFYVHYAGRSKICTKPFGHCDLCDAGKPNRWVGYLSATDLHRQKRFLVELTPGVMGVVSNYLEQYETLRAGWFTLTRPSQRPTGKLALMIAHCPHGLNPSDLPPAFDMAPVLGKIYGWFDPRTDRIEDFDDDQPETLTMPA